MDKKLAGELNEQIKNEIYSAYLYLSMSAYFEYEGLAGFSNWMRKQTKEEFEHAMKFFEFLSDRGERIILKEIPQPPVEFKSAVDVFDKTLEHEKKVTQMINDLYSLAKQVNDNPAVVFLEWFITEQVEEEKNAGDILGKLKKVSPDSGAFFMLDKVLGERN
jgi:ferritin